MVYKVVLDSLGDWNAFPEGMREISASEFWGLMNKYTPKLIEHRQPYVQSCEEFPGGYLWGDLTLYYLDDNEGIAFTVEWTDMQYWARHFWFGPCRHVYKELTQQECTTEGIVHFGRCFHVYRCEKCGKFQWFDSSD